MNSNSDNRAAGDVKLRVELGRQFLSAADLDGLSAGSVVELRSPADAMVDVYAGSKLLARGELVEVRERLGVRVRQLRG